VRGIEVEFRSSRDADTANHARATSDAGGRFEFGIGEFGGTVALTGESWTAVYEPHIRVPGPAEGYVLVVAPRRPFSGRVVDEGGNAVEAATVTIDLSGAAGTSGARESLRFIDRFRASIPLPLDDSVIREWSARSDVGGAFCIPNAPGLETIPIFVAAHGFQNFRAEFSPERGEAVLVLKQLAEPPAAVHGRVVVLKGEPVQGAMVMLGALSTTTDPQGEFALDLSRWDGGLRLIAAKPGWQSVVQECRGASPGLPGAWPEPLELALDRELSPIRGRIIDENGKPLEGVEIRALDPVSYDELLESLGSAIATDSFRAGHGHRPNLREDVVQSDADGRFEMKVLLQRAFRLRALDNRSKTFAVTDPVVPGTGEITITLATCSNKIAYAGKLVDLRGKPIAAAKVFACRSMPEPNSSYLRTIVLGTGETNDAGEFQLEAVCSPVDSLDVQVEPAGPGTVCPIDPRNDPRSTTLVVGRMAHVQIELVSAGLKADSVTMLDAAGKQLQIGARRGDGGWIGGETMPIRSGRTEPLIVSEAATTAVIYRNGSEVARMPVRATSGEMLTVRF
jgi:hypothetical protein